MARSSLYTRQVARLRNFLVVSYVRLAAASLGLAFILSWYDKPNARWFIGSSVLLGLWAAVTATCNRVTAGEFLDVAKVVGFKKPSADRKAA